MKKCTRICYMFILLSTVFSEVYSQENKLDKIISFEVTNCRVDAALKLLSIQEGIDFSYNPNDIPVEKIVSVKAQSVSIHTILKMILPDDEGLMVMELDGQVIIHKVSSKSRGKHVSKPESGVIVSGFIADVKTSESLIGATILDPSTGQGAVSNTQGFYSIRLPSKDVYLRCTYVGYDTIIINCKPQRDTLISINLPASSIEMTGVVFNNSGRLQKGNDYQLGMERIGSQQVKKMPVLLGESDVLKSLQLLPGVQAGNEGSSGLYIRGGSPDQNLILLDGVPVYNAYHVFGFFSVFNTDALRDVTLMKGSIPARYGGRLSSVLDITMNEGNLNKYGADISLGLVASKFMVEGPIVKGKSSFLITGRRTNVDMFAQPINRYFVQNKKGGDNKFYFYDINAKINYMLSERSRIFLSFYTGNDYSGFASKETINDPDNNSTFTNQDESKQSWGNVTFSARYHQVIAPSLFSNITLYYTRYKYLTTDKISKVNVEDSIKSEYSSQRGYSSMIEDIGARVQLDYSPFSSNKFRGGALVVSHNFEPGVQALRTSTDEYVQPIDTSFGNTYNPFEYTGYLEYEQRVGSKLEFNLGAAYTVYRNGSRSFNCFQPRASASLKLTPRVSVKTAYSVLNQNLHLLSNSSNGLPTDMWLPATVKVSSEKGSIASAGLFVLPSQGYEISLEGFYKRANGLISYKEGMSAITGNLGWEDKVEIGSGLSYGIEILLRKNIGKTTGWIGYTLSKTERKFSGINNGKSFPFRYDRRHDLSIVVNHEFSERFDIGITWVYATGNAITIPNYQLYAPLSIVGWMVGESLYTDSYNGVRTPAYHRLDVGLNFHRKLKWAERTFSFGLYNAYNRSNVYKLYIGYTEAGPKVKYKSLMPVLPYITYRLKF